MCFLCEMHYGVFAIILLAIDIVFADSNDDITVYDTNPDYVLIDDMILSPQQYDILFTEPHRRNGYARVVSQWPNGVVPYMIDGAPEKNLIRTAMALIEKESCVRFERLYDGHGEKDYIYIQPGYGCASTVGHNEGRQAVYLHKVGCMDVGRILHEILHVLGFFHMHTAYNRDEYISIMWENIVQSALQNFVPFETEISTYGTEYDFDSVMHYPTKAFSKDGKPTIISNVPEGEELMGNRDHLSKGDITRLNRAYNCA